MKTLLLFTAAIFITGSAFGQTPLYHGHYDNNTIDVMDTTGGYTISSTLTLTNDIASPIYGCYGLSLHPDTDEMYILYRDASECNSRIGTIDLASGFITDIGDAGNLTDICFYGSTLYGNQGYSCESCEIVEVDITDASTTVVSADGSYGYGHGLAWDLDNNLIFRINDDDNNHMIVDPSDWSVTVITPGTFPNVDNYTNGCVYKNDSILVISGGDDIWEMNTNDYTSVSVFSGASSVGHAIAFGAYPLLIQVAGPTTFCSDEASTLSLNETGTTYQWFLDGSPIAGATGPTHVPAATGTYTCDLDGTISLQKFVTVYPAPTASYTFAPDPADLGVDPTGSVTFTNTSTGGDTYSWDFGGGFFSALENPIYPFAAVGSFPVEFIVTESATGCDDTANATATVINTTSVLELSSDFEFYPNPVEDVLTISTESGNGTYKVKLIDLNGKVLDSEKIDGSAELKFDMSEYETGFYLVKIFNKLEEQYFKVLKK